MANETLYQKHLRVYSEETLVQKFRTERVYVDYENAEYKLRNSITDESTLINNLIRSNPSAVDKIELVQKRKEKSEGIRNDISRYMLEAKKSIEEFSNALQVHLYEYSNNEIQAAGFITHTVVADYTVSNNASTKVLKFNEPGKAEYGIANSLDKWRDASKMKITLRKED